MSSTTTPYHHGDLPSALVRAAIELMEEGGAAELSLRAAARRAGVSTAAPYRHFADRNALLSSVAAVGYRELGADLLAVNPAPMTAEDIADIAVAYVRFALARPGMFRVMFAEGCDPTNAERVSAVAAIHEYLHGMVHRIFPDANPEPLATAAWALVHGLAFLHLDGKLDVSSDEAVDDRIRTAILAVFKSRIE